MSVLYHLDKENVGVAALIHMTMGTVSHVDDANKDLVKVVDMLAYLGVRLEDFPRMVGLWFIITSNHPWWLR